MSHQHACAFVRPGGRGRRPGSRSPICQYGAACLLAGLLADRNGTPCANQSENSALRGKDRIYSIEGSEGADRWW